MARRCRAAALALVPLAGAWVSYRPVPPLDDVERAELAALSERIAGTRVRVEGASDAAAALAVVPVAIGEAEDALTLTVSSSGPRFVCLNPIYVLALGLLPYRVIDGRRYEWTVAGPDGRASSGEIDLTSSTWVGWLVAPISLLPDRRLGATWDKESYREANRPGHDHERLALGLARALAGHLGR